jgi:hypothetical protein
MSEFNSVWIVYIWHTKMDTFSDVTAKEIYFGDLTAFI